MLCDKVAEYRQRAEGCRVQALAAWAVDDKTAWLAMAKEWMRLGEEAEAELVSLEAALKEP